MERASSISASEGAELGPNSPPFFKNSITEALPDFSASTIFTAIRVYSELVFHE
jgi:hypothetical protein